jgi:Uma2 family endonuclease
MSHDTRLFTADQLLAMANDGQRRELVRGELRTMSPAGGRHGRVALKLARRLGDHVERYRLGETFAAETGFLLERDPDTVRAPDVAFVSYARLGGLADELGYLPVAPDLVCEVVSPTDRWPNVQEKVLDWLAFGVATVLVVDPQSKTVWRHQSADDRRMFTAGAIDLADVIPGLVLDVADLFS